MKPIAPLSAAPEGRLSLISSGPKKFLVYRNGDMVSVCGNLCPHHGEALCDGAVHDGVLTCPRHHARFNLETGAPVSPPALDGITVYESEIAGGEILVGRPLSAAPAPVTPEKGARVVIIGAGAAGMSCAEALRRRGFPGEVVVLTDEKNHPYDRTALTTTHLVDQSADGLLLRDPALLDLLAIDVRNGELVTEVDKNAKTLRTESGQSISYGKLLIAAGAAARKLEFPGNDLDGVNTLRTIDDTIRIGAALDSTPNVVIIGAGFLGVEAAFTLAALGKQVTVAAPEPRPLEHPFGKSFSERIVRRMAKAGISWLPGRTVAELRGAGSVGKALFGTGDTVDCGAVIIAAGIEAPALPSGLEELSGDDGWLRVGPRLRTTDPDIFAAGDVLEKPIHAGHWVTAMRQGWYAAGSILDDSEPYAEIPFFWSDMSGETVKAVGSAAGDAPTVIHGDISEGEFFAVWRKDGSSTGGFTVGYDEELIELEHTLRIETRGKGGS